MPGRSAGSQALARHKSLTRGRDPHGLDRFRKARVQGRLGNGGVAGQQGETNNGSWKDMRAAKGVFCHWQVSVFRKYFQAIGT